MHCFPPTLNSGGFSFSFSSKCNFLWLVCGNDDDDDDDGSFKFDQSGAPPVFWWPFLSTIHENKMGPEGSNKKKEKEGLQLVVRKLRCKKRKHDERKR